MAKPRPEYFYNPIDFNPDVAVGIKLPFWKTKWVIYSELFNRSTSCIQTKEYITNQKR